MPGLSRFLLRVSLIALLCGGGLGAWRLAHPLRPQLGVRAAHIEIMLFGWLVPFVVGTAYWMLPRAARLPERGNPMLAWTGALLLVLGSLCGVVLQLIHGPPALLHLATGLRSTGILLLLLLLWPRVKPFRTTA